MPRALPAAALCAALASCTGRIGDAPDPSANGGGGGGPPVTCEGVFASAVPLRRMNDLQYRNTIRDLFDGAVPASEAFPATTAGLGYSTAAVANVVSRLGAEQILEAAEDVAVAIVEDLPALLPCAAAADEACARSFIDTYGRRAFRRPLRAEERTLLLDLFREVRADTPFPESIGAVATAMLQMPQFLYFVEEQRGDAEVQRLDPFEVATRLSFLFWNTTPDDALLDAAASGALSDRAGVEAEARRLLADPRAAEMIGRFFFEWADLRELAEIQKDRRIYPEWSTTLAVSLEQEIERFVAHVMTEEGGTLDALLLSNRTYVNRPLALLYGLDPSISASPSDWKLVTLDAGERAGILTKPGLLAAKAHASSTSPIFRGKFVRTQLLCDEIPAPPPDAMQMAPEYPPNATQREKSDILVAAESCGGCHRMMNPLGLGFEGYDALGKRQTMEANGQPIDTSGQIVDGPFTEFDGVVDLSRKLASSEDARECMVRHWFRYSFGKRETAWDRCTIEALDRGFAGSSHRLGDLLVSIAVSDAFANRAIGGGTR